MSKNWPYAYRNLQESLSELVPHLQRNNIEEPGALNPHINRETPLQLGSCITILSKSVDSMKNSDFLEQKVTGMLLERLIMDAGHFKTDLEKEIAMNPTGLDTYLEDY